MARSRIIRPEFWSDEKLASVSREARLTYAGLWGTSDDYGVTKGNAAWLKSQIFPYDDDLKLSKFQEWLTELERLKRIFQFSVDGEKYYYIGKFSEHQKVDKPSKTRNPEPPKNIDSRDSSETVASDSRDSSDETDTDTDTDTDTSLVGRASKNGNIPYADIQAAYNEILQDLPACKSITDKRRKAIKCRWQTDERTATLSWWRDEFFPLIADSDFLTGRSGKWTGCNIDWILKAENFQKIREGTYNR
jgi:hypothetical protein